MMVTGVTRLAAVLLTGLLAGTGMGLWFVESRPLGTAAAYAEYKQAAIAGYSLPLPLLGFGSLVVVLVLLASVRADRVARLPVLAAAVLLVAGIVLSVAVHFPLNAEIAAWSPQSPPADWAQDRDTWHTANGVRVLLNTAAFALLAATATLVRRAPQETRTAAAA